MQSIINSVYDSAEIARKELERVDLSKTLIETAVISGASAASSGTSSIRTELESQRNHNDKNMKTDIGNKEIYASKAEHYYAPKTYDDLPGGCGIFSYSMVLANLGIKNNRGEVITPYDFYQANGNSVYIKNKSVEVYGYSVITKNINNLSLDDKVIEIKNAIMNHPEGIILRWQNTDGERYTDRNGNQSEHFVVATGVDADGDIIVNDPWWNNLKGVKLTKQNALCISNYKVMSAK